MRAWLIAITAGAACHAPPGDVVLDGSIDGEPGDAAVRPTWSNEMTAAGAADFYTRSQPDGAVELGVADPAAGDGTVARLRFPGIPALGNTDRIGPASASELATLRRFGYGTYRVRVQLAACAPGEEVVNGLFTYFNDGADHDGDGLVDNAEIDLEVLCATPDVLFLTVWTEYTFATEAFRKWTRAIDLATGDIWESPSDRAYGLERRGNDPELRLPALLDPGQFVELGFEWRADRVRYFATVEGVERTLAELTDPARIPSLPGALMFNAWHPGEHWFGGGGPPDYPATDAVLLVDRAAYWE